MSKRTTIHPRTRNNWLIDTALFLGGLLTALSGIYFLFLPSGGYQGGRNPLYGVTVLFSRHTWDDLHTWGGVLMIAAAVVHFAIHWRWVKMMSKRMVDALLSRGSRLSKGGTFNVALDALVALSFLITAVSGIYFLFAPSGGFQGGRNPGWDPGVLFSRTAWDLIHTWGGVLFISAAVVHFWIHWRWVKNVTKKVFLSLWQRPALSAASAAG
jgi:cytochrome b subunit of formate dehydrogenase